MSSEHCYGLLQGGFGTFHTLLMEVWRDIKAFEVKKGCIFMLEASREVVMFLDGSWKLEWLAMPTEIPAPS